MNKSETTIHYPKKYFEEIRRNKKRNIYDCFTFFNELDLLELRLEELDSVVDYFVICEAKKTFSGKSKKLFFWENRKRFSKWEDKIIYVIVEDMPKLNVFDNFLIWLEIKLPKKYRGTLRAISTNIDSARYKLEAYQRNEIMKALTGCGDDDVVLGLDLDEIPRAEKFDEMKTSLNSCSFVRFEQRRYFYYINGEEVLSVIPPGTMACKYKTLMTDFHGKLQPYRSIPSLWIRLHPDKYSKNNFHMIKNGGWHFSHLGGIKKIIEKFAAGSHPEVDNQNIQNVDGINRMIEEGRFPFSDMRIEYIEIDDTYPKTILKNMKKYSKYIK